MGCTYKESEHQEVTGPLSSAIQHTQALFIDFSENGVHPIRCFIIFPINMYIYIHAYIYIYTYIHLHIYIIIYIYTHKNTSNGHDEGKAYTPFSDTPVQPKTVSRSKQLKRSCFLLAASSSKRHFIKLTAPLKRHCSPSLD